MESYQSKVKEWNERQQKLKSYLSQRNTFEEGKELCLLQHQMVHQGAMSGYGEPTLEDMLWEGVTQEVFSQVPGVKGRTIAYGIWHSARIEDITVSLLVQQRSQVFTEGNWKQRIGATIEDTGNSLSPEEILSFSQSMDMEALKEYRLQVGQRTREMITQLTPQDLKGKVRPQDLERVLQEGAVLDLPGSIWLIDFWGRKNVLGILLMPVTRHHMVHLNESMKAKERAKKLSR